MARLFDSAFNHIEPSEHLESSEAGPPPQRTAKPPPLPTSKPPPLPTPAAPERRERRPGSPPEARPQPPATARPRRARATGEALAGRRRAAHLSVRLGNALREARLRAGRTQAACAATARISQPRWSELERGGGAGATVETWAVAAAAVGQELAAFLDASSGASLPRDIEHLRRQSSLVARAAAGGWAVAPEMPVVAGTGGRVIDALLSRSATREAAVVEVWDLLLDVGASLRSFDEKLAAVRASRPGWTVSGAWLIRGTRRNRGLIAELAPLFRARFAASAAGWLRALEGSGQMPAEPGLLWTDVRATSIQPARLRLPTTRRADLGESVVRGAGRRGPAHRER